MKGLKPCPFCGGEDISICGHSIVVDAFARCNTCGATTDFFNAEPDGRGAKEHPESQEHYEKRCAELARAAWNRRAGEEEADDRFKITEVCAKCGQEKEIACTVDGSPWCEDCFFAALGLEDEE